MMYNVFCGVFHLLEVLGTCNLKKEHAGKGEGKVFHVLN
jgi:hypothetical protein